MKKFLALLLAAIMVFALAGCGGSSGTTAAPTEAPKESETQAPDTKAEDTTKAQ